MVGREEDSLIVVDLAKDMKGPADVKKKPKVRMDDPRFCIRPMQQVASACTGALITALFSKFFIKYIFLYFVNIFI